MKIVHVTECLAGGVLTFIQNLTQTMPDEQHVLIYSDRPNTPKDVRSCFGKSVELVYWPHAGRELVPAQDFRATVSLYRLLRQYHDADVIHLHSSKAGFIGRVVCRLLGLKNVLYTPNGLSFAREDVSERKKQCYIWLEKVANAFSGDFVAVCQSERDLLVQNGIHNVYVINNGMDVRSEEPVYRAFHYPLVVGTVGRLTYQKNPELFWDIAQAFAGDERVRFVWIGDGELCSSLPKASNIELPGWVTLNEMRQRLQGMDVYLSTALWEGLPLSVLEAMNLGRSLLLTDCIGNHDLVDGSNGTLFTTASEAVAAIRDWIARPEQLSVQGQQSRSLLKAQFSLQGMARQYWDLYRRTGEVGR